MNDLSSKTPATPLVEQPSTKRLFWGILIFVLGQLTTFLIPLVTASNLSSEWKTILSGLFFFGTPQLSMMAAVAVLGKPGYNYIKAKVFQFIKKHGPAELVSRPRYTIGLVMFLIPVVFGFLEPYLGDKIPGHMANPQAFATTGDILLLVSLFVLGGEFWDKLRSLFVYRARAQFPA